MVHFLPAMDSHCSRSGPLWQGNRAATLARPAVVPADMFSPWGSRGGHTTCPEPTRKGHKISLDELSPRMFSEGLLDSSFPKSEKNSRACQIPSNRGRKDGNSWVDPSPVCRAGGPSPVCRAKPTFVFSLRHKI